MPTIHIPDSVFADYLENAGMDVDKAKRMMKVAVERHAGASRAETNDGEFLEIPSDVEEAFDDLEPEYWVGTNNEGMVVIEQHAGMFQDSVEITQTESRELIEKVERIIDE